jgi:hypothetical protein
LDLQARTDAPVGWVAKPVKTTRTRPMSPMTRMVAKYAANGDQMAHSHKDKVAHAAQSKHQHWWRK